MLIIGSTKPYADEGCRWPTKALLVHPQPPANNRFDRSRRSEFLNFPSVPRGGPVNRSVR